MEGALEEVKAVLAKSKDDMARYYGLRRSPAPSFQPRDRGYLDTSDIHLTRPSKKLMHHWLGPYKVTWKIRTHTYELTLPLALQRLHPVFHVIKLMPAPEDLILGRQTVPPPPLILREGEEHFKVEEVLDS
jgi:hypothetical protein